MSGKQKPSDALCEPCADEDIQVNKKPFKCDHEGCTSAFAQSGHLNRHKRTHTGEKPFKCDHGGCTSAFAQSGHLVVHKRTHTGEKPFKCEGCTSAFAQSVDLDKHKRTHTGEKPFKCDYEGCTTAFAQSGHLVRHMKRYHNDLYIARRKIEEQRVCEALLARGWNEWFHPETMPPTNYFKREKRIDFACVDPQDTWCRVDFVLGMDNGYIFFEVDEHQHAFGYGGKLSCDMKRMAKVMTSLTVEAGEAVPNVFWLRYNPHTWYIDGEIQSMSRTEREALLCDLVAGHTFTAPFSIGYAFYDSWEGVLDVLQNEEFHPEFAKVVVNLTIDRMCD
jgi:hypothetical protein